MNYFTTPQKFLNFILKLSELVAEYSQFSIGLYNPLPVRLGGIYSMIRIQPTSSDENRILVGSDLKDPDAAQSEISEWVNSNNCRMPDNPRRLAVYEDGMLVREWVLVERCVEPSRNMGQEMFGKLWQRKSTPENKQHAKGQCETIYLRFDRDMDRAA